MTTKKMKSLLENTYRHLKRADNDETPSQIGALILAIGDLAEAVEGLIENDIAHTQSANIASCLANGIIPD
jgi:hypothetical protein